MAKKTEAPLHVRVDGSLKDAFNAKCGDYGVNPSEFIRELMMAVVDNRITIRPTRGQLRTIKGVHA